MSMEITDLIDLIHPGADTQGNIISDTIWIIFDREVDEQSINDGNLLVEGPDTDSFIGPDVGFHLPNISDSGSDDQLNSPGYKGVVPGAITFERINLLDTDPYTGPDDLTGDGTLWRTKAIFTPSFAFQPLTEYKVYLTGDELPDDTNLTGIRTRTVFDTVVDPGNTGNGVVLFGGLYSGTIDDTYIIKITTPGAPGVAWYEWQKGSDPTWNGPVLSDAYNSQLLDKNVTVRLTTNSFNADDIFVVVVKPAASVEGNTYWVFTTGTGSIATLPDSVSTSITGSPQALIPTAFVVSSIVPKDTQVNVPLTTRRIVISCNDSIDPATVTADTVTITGRPVNGDESLFESRTIYADLTVSGSKLIIDI